MSEGAYLPEAVALVAGILLLVLGYRLFWLFVGGTGFLAGYSLAERFFEGHSGWVILATSLAAGALGVLLALLLGKMAVAAAGFFAGAWLGTQGAVALGSPSASGFWLGFVAGGILGALLLTLLFDWTLILFTSLAGAALFVQALHRGVVLSALLFVVLVAAGLFVQSRLKLRHPAPEKP